MGQGNNSLSENVYNTTGGTLGQWIGKEWKYMHFSTQILKHMHGTSLTTTHQLRMYNHNNASETLGQWIEKEKKYMMPFSIQTCMHILKNMHGTRQQLTP